MVIVETTIQVIGNADAAETAKSKSDRCTGFTDEIKLVNESAMTKNYTIIKDLKAFRAECRKYCVGLYAGSSQSETQEPS